MRRLFGVIVSVFVVASLCACTDYAQKIQDEYGPEDSSGKDGVSGEMTDYRDGRTYKTVSVGKVEWMAENLSYAKSGSLCFYNSPKLCDKYGRLYGWPLSDVCPDGWHVPDEGEWRDLFSFATPSALRSKNAGGTDAIGFSVKYVGAGEVVDIPTYMSESNDAKIDVKVKPSAYQNTDNCAPGYDWLNCADFFIEVHNNESNAISGMDLRFYLGNEFIEMPVSYISQLFGGEGNTVGISQVSFDSYVPDENGQYYLPIKIANEIPSGGWIVFQLKWLSMTYANFDTDAWSLAAHTGSDAFVSFDGIDLSQAPYFTGSELEQWEVDFYGNTVEAFKSDPYIPVYFDGARIAGYGPYYQPALFFGENELAVFWTSTQGSSYDQIYYVDISKDEPEISEDTLANYYLPVRCIRYK